MKLMFANEGFFSFGVSFMGLMQHALYIPNCKIIIQHDYCSLTPPDACHTHTHLPSLHLMHASPSLTPSTVVAAAACHPPSCHRTTVCQEPGWVGDSISLIFVVLLFSLVQGVTSLSITETPKLSFTHTHIPYQSVWPHDSVGGRNVRMVCTHNEMATMISTDFQV